MTDESKFEQAIFRWLKCQYVRCRTTQGMWLIEVVLNNVDSAGKKAFWGQIGRQATTTLGAGHVIWKAYIYAKDEERYTGQATLHTLPSKWENGMLTTILSATDCYLDITEFDSEILQMGVNDHTVYGKESIDDRNNPILPFQNGTIHTWAEVMGGSYNIKNNGVRLIKSNQHPYFLEIDLT